MRKGSLAELCQILWCQDRCSWRHIFIKCQFLNCTNWQDRNIELAFYLYAISNETFIQLLTQHLGMSVFSACLQRSIKTDLHRHCGSLPVWSVFPPFGLRCELFTSSNSLTFVSDNVALQLASLSDVKTCLLRMSHIIKVSCSNLLMSLWR